MYTVLFCDYGQEGYGVLAYPFVFKFRGCCLYLRSWVSRIRSAVDSTKPARRRLLWYAEKPERVLLLSGFLVFSRLL